MRSNEKNTPPSSVNGDEITEMEGYNDVIYLDDMEELQFDEDMEDLSDQEEEDTDMPPPEDHAKLVFQEHAGSVFCCDLHPDGSLAVTGGEDDKAFVWRTQTGHVIMNCSGHKDSVIFVGFSFDGVYLATADMCGLIKVWKCDVEGDQPWPLVFEYEADDLTWGMWHPKARVLMCGTVNGDIFIFKIPSGETKVLQGHNLRVECGKLFPDGVRLAAGYEDGAVKVWDLKNNSVVQHIQPGPTTHTIRVTAIDVHPDNNLIASISSDGKVVFSTSSNGKVVVQLDYEIDLESVAFPEDPQLGYFALGTLNGAVSIWDLAHHMVRHHCTKSSDDVIAGVTKITWIKNHLVTGCLDGSIRAYAGQSGSRSLLLTGHRSEVLDLCYNEKEKLILTTSDDGTARLFKYELNNEND